MNNCHFYNLILFIQITAIGMILWETPTKIQSDYQFKNNISKSSLFDFASTIML